MSTPEGAEQSVVNEEPLAPEARWRVRLASAVAFAGAGVLYSLVFTSWLTFQIAAPEPKMVAGFATAGAIAGTLGGRLLVASASAPIAAAFGGVLTMCAGVIYATGVLFTAENGSAIEIEALVVVLFMALVLGPAYAFLGLPFGMGAGWAVWRWAHRTHPLAPEASGEASAS